MKSKGEHSGRIFSQEEPYVSRGVLREGRQGEGVGENARPVSVHLVIGEYGVCCSPSASRYVTVRYRDRHAVSRATMLVRKIVP